MKKTTFFFLSVLSLLFMGSNAWAETYSHTFLTTDIPQNTTETSFTLSGVDWTLAMEEGVVSVFSNDLGTHFGTNAKTCKSVSISTEGIPGTILGVTVEASRGKNLVGTMAVSVNGTEYTLADGSATTALETTNAAYEYTGGASGEIVIAWTMTGGQGAFYIKKITVEYTTGGVVVAKPVISPAGGAFSEPQEVTISTEEGLTAYYTLDGTDPTNESTAYVAPFTVSTDCTVKAVAYDAAGNASSVASVEFQFAKTYTNIADLCAAATEAKEPVLVEFNNWICTGVKNSNAYFTDGRNGILLYQNGHGFAVGDVLTGRAQISLTLYNECAEIVGLTSTTEGLTVTKGGEATPQKVMVADLEKNMQGCLISLEGVTYTGGVFVDDDDNSITPYGTFIKLPELYEGKTYDVTGVAIWYKNSQVWEIAPRTADEFVLKTSQVAPVSAWSVESESVDIEGQPTAKFTTNSDGVVTYESSDPEVATIDADGRITPKAYGTTVITANVAETATYLADSKSFTLIVKEKGYADAIFAYNDADISGQGVSSTGGEFTAVRNDVVTLHVNKAYANPNDNHIKIYGSKVEKGAEGEEPTLTEPSYIELTVADGYAIKSIVLTAAGESYIKEWKDQFGTAAEVDGPTATWSGDMGKVVLTNQATSQARIQTITVTYVDTSIIDAIAAPAAAVQETAIYNLAGQRMQKMQKGINIVNGKKVLR